MVPNASTLIVLSLHASGLKWWQFLLSFNEPQVLVGPFRSRTPASPGFSFS